MLRKKMYGWILFFLLQGMGAAFAAAEPAEQPAAEPVAAVNEPAAAQPAEPGDAPAAVTEEESAKAAQASDTAKPVPAAAVNTQAPATAAAADAVKLDSSKSGAAAAPYTGLVIDCRGLGLKPVMSPVIRNANGEPIYGYKHLDYQKIQTDGLVSYSSDIKTVARAGKNPLIIKAASLENYNGYPVLSLEDANLVLLADRASGFLEHYAVVFVR